MNDTDRDTSSSAPGPTSSDRTAEANIRRRLCAGGRAREFRRLCVRVDAACVRLTGCVATFHLKQIAQEAAAHEAPGRRVVSTVVVCATACEPCDDEL